jgi:hypothetical protein
MYIYIYIHATHGTPSGVISVNATSSSSGSGGATCEVCEAGKYAAITASRHVFSGVLKRENTHTHTHTNTHTYTHTHTYIHYIMFL